MLGNLLQLERQFIETLNFGANRYIQALRNRKDLLSSKEHEILFKSIEGIKSIVEVIYHRETPEHVVQAYKANVRRFIEEYENYFAMVKLADNIVIEKTHHPEFIKFIANPSIPSSQPIFHNFLQRPLEYFTELQKNFQILLGQYRIDCQEYEDLNRLIHQLQVSFLLIQEIAVVHQFQVVQQSFQIHRLPIGLQWRKQHEPKSKSSRCCATSSRDLCSRNVNPSNWTFQVVNGFLVSF